MSETGEICLFFLFCSQGNETDFIVQILCCVYSFCCFSVFGHSSALSFQRDNCHHPARPCHHYKVKPKIFSLSYGFGIFERFKSFFFDSNIGGIENAPPTHLRFQCYGRLADVFVVLPNACACGNGIYRVSARAVATV